MTDNLSVFVGYLENPHTDIYERGVEAAKHMRECLAGARTAVTMVKVPLVPPQISLLTAKGPYADLIKYGQTKVGGDILNVSVMAGFAYSDSPKNGLTAVVTARNGNRQAAAALSLDIAKRAWGMKERFKRQMTAMADAVQLATSVGRDRRRKAIILADVADNPGGGGRGNTTYLLRALKAARAQHVIFGVFNDAAVAAKAHELGEGAIFTASFNSQEHQEFSLPFDCEAKVVKLSDGKYVGRRGVLQERVVRHGPLGPARPRRHPARGHHQPLPVHGPDAVRDVRPRHRPGAGRRGQEPRPFPRRFRRVLQYRSDLRSRLSGLDVADPGELHLDQVAAAGLPARRRNELDATHWRLKTAAQREAVMLRRSLIALAGAVLLSAPASAQSPKTLRVVMHSDLKIVDPVWTTAYIVRNHGYLIYDTLFAIDGKFEPQPQMVESWTVSDDKLTWTFKLRDGLKWHDGTPVTVGRRGALDQALDREGCAGRPARQDRPRR